MAHITSALFRQAALRNAAFTSGNRISGKEKWKYAVPKPMIGGVAASGGDIPFVGELTGAFRVFDVRNGSILYTHSVDGPIAGRTVSYEAKGHQGSEFSRVLKRPL